MPMYNLIEYSTNCSGTAFSLWFYSKNQATIFNVNITGTEKFKYLEYKAKLVGNT